jgi:undecaprenyl-diphosphatase
MTILQSLILGIVQGITEFLPISSSAHLVLVPEFFNWGEHSLTFDIVAHSGTLLAIVIYYRKRLLSIFNSLLKQKKESKYKNLLINIILTTIPTVIIYFLLKDYIDDILGSTEVIQFTLIIGGVLLLIADIYSKKNTNHKKISYLSASLIGIGQGLSLIRGMSRSGTMLTIGLFSKIDRKQLLEYVFLASIPIISAGLLLKSIEYVNNPTGEGIAILFLGFISSFLSGLLAINLLNRLIDKNIILFSAIYRIVIALLMIFI